MLRKLKRAVHRLARMGREAIRLSVLELLPGCEDCPLGGREGDGPLCLRRDLCDLECEEDMDALDQEA